MTSLLESHGTRLHAVLYRLVLRSDVADDLLQDLTVRLAAAEAFATADSPYAYARTAAVRIATDWHRRQRPRRGELTSIDLDALSHEDRAPGPTLALERREQWEGLLSHLARMKEDDQLLLTMRYLDGCGFEEIAGSMGTGTTPHQARGLVHKALRRLRQRVGVSRQTDPSRRSEVTHD